MAVDIKVSRDLGNNFVQIDISSKNSEPAYYALPKDKVKSFVSNYKKDKKNNAILTNTVFIGSLLLGALTMSKLVKNMKSSPFVKGLINICGTVSFSMFSTYLCDNYIQTKRNELMKNHQAKQIFYNA